MIGKTIKSILAGNSTLIALVPAVRMFPYVMNEGTTLPAIIYTVDSLLPDYTKGGWMLDEVAFSVASFADDYSELQTVVSAIRGALELSQVGAGTQSINKIYLTGMDESFDQEQNVFGNRLNFSVKINAY
jgi:hypothetical protein